MNEEQHEQVVVDQEVSALVGGLPENQEMDSERPRSPEKHGEDASAPTGTETGKLATYKRRVNQKGQAGQAKTNTRRKAGKKRNTETAEQQAAARKPEMVQVHATER